MMITWPASFHLIILYSHIFPMFKGLRKTSPQRALDVYTTSQRHDVASTMRRRCIDVMCLLCLVLQYIVNNIFCTWRSLDAFCGIVKIKFSSKLSLEHYENTPIQKYWKFEQQKNENFQIQNSNIFHISLQNIDCGYSLEPPRRGGTNEYPQSMF